MSGRIAFFDFDGTITTKDTLLEFIRFSAGNGGFVGGFLINSPWLIALKAGIISNQKAKERILTYFFGGMPVARFSELCNSFSSTLLPNLLRPKALKEIELLKQQGFEICVVSASPELWLSPWAYPLKLELIGSLMEEKNETLTGKLIGKNCYGQEKVNRIKGRFELANYSTIYAYGDSAGDKELLQLATKSFYKPFR